MPDGAGRRDCLGRVCALRFDSILAHQSAALPQPLVQFPDRHRALLCGRFFRRRSFGARVFRSLFGRGVSRPAASKIPADWWAHLRGQHGRRHLWLASLQHGIYSLDRLAERPASADRACGRRGIADATAKLIAATGAWVGRSSVARGRSGVEGGRGALDGARLRPAHADHHRRGRAAVPRRGQEFLRHRLPITRGRFIFTSAAK